MINTKRRIVAFIVTLVMMFTAMPVTALASIPNWEDENKVFEGTSFGTNGYYNVISKKDYVLVPGAAVESEIVINNSQGTRRQVLHVIEVDPSNPDVSIVPGYYQIDQLAEDPMNKKNWSHQELTEMAKYYEKNLGYNIVGGMNTDLYYNSQSPRVLVYNGQSIGNFGKDVTSDGSAFNATSSILYVFKDADGNISCDVKAFNKAELEKYLADGILLHAVGVSFGMVVKDGELVNSVEKRGNDDAARSMVGVKADGTLVICMNDGRGANNSVGFSSYEEGEAMLALGCQWAANCDGGGSSTFISKRVGEEEITMRSVPCDGAQRPTAHGIFVASNVAPTGELDVVNIESEYDIFAPNTAYTFGAEAIDTHGYAMAMPEDASWVLSDSTFGTLSGGTFVSNGKKGSVNIQVLSGGKVVGEKTILVADPETFKLSATSTVVPYSTPDNMRTITIPIVSMTGEANVYVDTNAVSITLSNNAAGVLDGFKFTATDDTSITGVDVIVKYGAIVLTYAIEFGKGSEIIWDFEDGEKSGFMGFEEAKKWSSDNGVNNTLVGLDPLAGQFNEYLSSETFVSSLENGGQVRNGNYALAWRLDNTDASFGNWSYNVLFNVGETIVLRDVENGMKATTLGMWIYIPENAFPAAGKGLAFQSQLYTKNADGTYSCKQDHFMFTSASTGNLTNLNSATNADIPESRWVYATIDISKYDYLCTPVATDEGNSRSPSFIRTYVKPDTADEVTFYIDDITLDYSSAVDDRVLPTITSPTYSTSDVAVNLNNGDEVIGNKFAFSANVADNMAIDLTSGRIFVDGVEIKSSLSSKSLASAEDVVLSAGKHTVAFEVKDELGNPARLTRTFTVLGDAIVELSGHNESGAPAMAQSVYFVDIKVSDIANVNKLVAVLKLNNSNTWETKGAYVADGFIANFEYNEISELLTVTVEATGANKGKTLDNILVSIPVRVWTYDRYNFVTNADISLSELGNKPIVNVKCDVVYGSISLNDKTTSPFGGNIDVATELSATSSPYHEHDEELSVLNKAATTVEVGYENRTYCETCKSVVDWGTILPKLEITHNYEIKDGKFVCTYEGCGEVYDSGTGIFEMNGALYYSIAGNLLKGWQTVEAGAYCFAKSNYQLAVGEMVINKVTYNFGDNGITEGAWVSDANGTKFSYGADYYRCGAGNPHANVIWVVISGQTYAFDRKGYRHEGISMLVESNNPGVMYEFTEEGVLVGEYKSDYTGIFVCNNGTTYLENGTPVAAGLVKFEGYYYYINSGYVAVVGSYNVTRPNGLVPAGTYLFDKHGKMLNPPKLKNGPQDDGFFYLDGVKQFAYQLIEYNGDYYFINDAHKYAKNTRIYLSGSFIEGTDFKAGYYNFDAEGKMIIQNGPQDDGFFYLDGIKQFAYQLIEYNGDYYFINDAHKYAKNTRIYLSGSFIEGTDFKAGYYNFDAEGKMIIQNGPQADGYFYINGVKQLAYQLVEYEGNYYFVNDAHKLAKNTKIYLSGKFIEGTDLVAGYYEFDVDGKMVIDNGSEGGEVVLKNGPQADGYFYIDGVKQSCYQLVKYEGNYYFINDGHKLAKNTKIYLSGKFIEGTDLVAGYYEFDAEGKMVIKNGPQDDGFFYINGIKQFAYQLIEYNGDYYFINDGNKVVKNRKMHIEAEFLVGTYFQPGYYEFDSEGRMIGGLNGLANGRDLGDIPFLKTTDGYDIKSGLLLRGGETDDLVKDITDEQMQLGIDIVKDFGIKTEMDLRSSSEIGEDLFGESILHKYYGMVLYDAVFTERGKAVVKDIFKDLANPENYPIYLHCTYGIDRAGTVCYLLEALLGVSESDALREYLLSVGSYGISILKVEKGLKAYGGATLKECAELYLLDCGVTMEEIETIREIFIED